MWWLVAGVDNVVVGVVVDRDGATEWLAVQAWLGGGGTDFEQLRTCYGPWAFFLG